MGVHAIIWDDAAADKFLEVFLWYKQECGMSFARKFYVGILRTIDTLSKMPTIGIREPELSMDGQEYYSFLAHRKFRIVYKFDETTITIVEIWSTLQKNW